MRTPRISVDYVRADRFSDPIGGLRITVKQSYDVKYVLKARGYRYDGTDRSWWKDFHEQDDAREEIEWMTGQGWEQPLQPHILEDRLTEAFDLYS